MHRLGCVVVIGALAVAVSVVGAGPAVAAKGGNNDTAKLCQKGGWKALVPQTRAARSPTKATASTTEPRASAWPPSRVRPHAPNIGGTFSFGGSDRNRVDV